MKIGDVMESARLKIKRANRHIDEIIADQASLPKRPYNLGVIHQSVAPLRYPDCDLLIYTPRESISKHFGAIVGDAVNNLRESLDIWMNNAALCVGPITKLHFPFSAKREDLETSKHFISVKKAFLDAATFIAENIEPCRDTNLNLWAATSLCNANKHNDLFPLVGLSSIRAQHIVTGNNSFENITLRGDANKPFRLIRAPLQSLSIKGDLKLSIEITFPNGAIFEDQPVVPTLTHMSQVVSQTLDALERFIQPYCVR